MQLPLQQPRYSSIAAIRSHWISVPHSFVALLAFGCLASTAYAQISLPTPSQKPPKNEQAATILRQMAETYARLPSLQQRTVYTSTLLSLKPNAAKPPLINAVDGSKSGQPQAKADASAAVAKPAEGDVADDSPNRRVDRTVELLYVQPNLLKITDAQTNASTPAETSTWVSDGKTFSAFIPKSHGSLEPLYTQEKSPRTIRGFTKLHNLDGNSLELVMLMGVNPFQNLTPEAATVRVEEPALVRGVQTDVISMMSVTRTERDVLHFYIGREDHMLYRFVSEVSPFQDTRAAPRIGDALDEIADETRPSAPPAKGSDREHPLEAGDTGVTVRNEAQRTRVVYDNLISPVTHVELAEFTFTPPPGSALFMPAGSKQTVDPNAKRLTDLIRKSAEGHAKPVHDVTNVHEISP